MTYEFIGVWDEIEADFEDRPIERLIRCKDCKYYGFNDWLHCPMTDSKADDYCSRGERHDKD